MKKLLLTFIFCLFWVNAYAATQLKKTVMPSGGDYTSLEACMNANEQNLVTADKYFDVEIDGTWSSADTTTVAIHNYTTDATRYINIYTTTAARHDGRASAISGRNNYRINQSTTNSYHIFVGAKYTTIKGIEFMRSSPGTWDRGGVNWAVQCDYGIIADCLFHDLKVYDGAIEEYAARYFTAYNNIIYNITKNGDNKTGAGVRIREDTGWAHIYNNTVYNAVIGFWSSNEFSVPAVAKNNLCYNNTTDYSGTFHSTSTNNLAKDTTAPPLNTYYNSKTISFVNVSAGTEDFHLVSGDTDAIDQGADLSATFTDDIDGVTRTGTWDIGADEYVAAATGYGQVIIISD